MSIRGSGILIHITSLPSRFGIGDLGPTAYEFVEFLAKAGQRYWQILPIHPTDPEFDNSPYHALSAFAYNHLLISPELLVSDGYLKPSDIRDIPEFPEGYTDFATVIPFKDQLFEAAFLRFSGNGCSEEYFRFCHENSWWLDEYALFMVIRKHYAPIIWNDWPPELKFRHPEALERIQREQKDAVEKIRFIQFLFQIQWRALRRVCREKGVLIIGDIPIYVDYDSADLWTHPSLFKLDENGRPTVIAGVPPDYFSITGQIWNSPIYNWEEMERRGFSWWISRIRHLISHVDYVRIDHFRGLCGYWEIPAGSKTAVAGRWVNAPGFNLLRTLARKGPYLPIIAEDLGVITPDVREIMHYFSIPGMKVLQFAFGFGMPDNPYIIHNIPQSSVVYTGTHDNNPALGWYTRDTNDTEKSNLTAYLGREVEPSQISRELIRLAMMSRADTAILLMQDLLNLDESSRMNKPGTETGNWIWRVSPSLITKELSDELLSMTTVYGRI